jgi:hypothetical protein
VADSGTLHFAFTYPYTYTMVQNDLNAFNDRVNVMDKPDNIFYHRELLTYSPDGLRIDLVTITSIEGASDETEELLPGLFPDNLGPEATPRPLIFPDKEVIFISARVHSGEVPAQHTFKGILDFLMDPHDIRAIEMRKRYVFKMIPILNPDGKNTGTFYFILPKLIFNFPLLFSSNNRCLSWSFPMRSIWKQLESALSQPRRYSTPFHLCREASPGILCPQQEHCHVLGPARACFKARMFYLWKCFRFF